MDALSAITGLPKEIQIILVVALVFHVVVFGAKGGSSPARAEGETKLKDPRSAFKSELDV
jgi:hypothetical protein